MNIPIAILCIACITGNNGSKDFVVEIKRMNDYILKMRQFDGMFRPSVDARNETLKFFNSEDSKRIKRILKDNGVENSSAVLDVADLASQKVQKSEQLDFAALIRFGIKRQKMYQNPVVHKTPPPPPI
jgi:hypothetical protein